MSIVIMPDDAHPPHPMIPRRAEQVPSASSMNATPKRVMVCRMSPRAHMCLRGRIPTNNMGPLLHAPAHLSRAERGNSRCKYLVRYLHEDQ